jgi:hypothetical protein
MVELTPIKAIPTGTSVKIGQLDVTITSIVIRGNKLVQYEVSWIVNGDRKTSLVESYEVEHRLDDAIEIGFEAK